MSKKKQKQHKFNKVTEPELLLGLLMVFLFCLPFFKGLFFEKELLAANIISAVMMIILLYRDSRERKLELFKSPVDYAWIGFIVIYIAATIGAVNIRESLVETLGIINYFFIFILISYYASKGKINILLKNLFLSGTIVALTGLLSASNIIRLEYAIVDGRITSTLQYPNTLAAYLMAIMVIGIGLMVTEQRFKYRLLMAMGNFIVILTFIGTKSRGGLLVLPLILLILIVGPLKGYRMRLIVKSLLLLIVSVLISLKYYTDNIYQPDSIIWVLTGLFAVALIEVISYKVMAKKHEFSQRKYKYVPAILICLVISAGLFFVIQGGGHNLKSGGFERLGDISLSSRNVQERIVFVKDAIEIVKENPLLGVGGGGWEILYRQYRSHLYIAALIHNHFAQIWVEAGTLGLAAFLALWITMFYMVAKLVRRMDNPEEKMILWVCFCAAIALGMHSLIDFNLSFGAISIILWSMFGVVRGNYESYLKGTKFVIPMNSKGLVYTLTGMMAVYILISGSFFISNRYGQLGMEELAKGGNATSTYFEKAIMFNPLADKYYNGVAAYWYGKGAASNSRTVIKKGLEFSERAVALSPMTPEYHKLYGMILLAVGDLDKGVTEIERSGQLAKYDQQSYDSLSSAYLLVAQHYLEKGEDAKAEPYLIKLQEIPDAINKEMAAVPDLGRKLWRPGADFLKVTPIIEKNISEAEKINS